MIRSIGIITATLLLGTAHTLLADAAPAQRVEPASRVQPAVRAVEATRIDGSIIQGEWLPVDEPGKIGLRTKDRREIMSADDLISLR
ncbi:MAG: hypothetical protein IIB58_05110, partial [Planctomycetes bacterium]|nr:hypothetical protein [Planctomycetota bacterium]